ncbi:MAG: helix-turn-helix domain-containing protein [Pirellulales bacterium]|nr:helix-turn-helix domain-containing protein [Pirellulales bacterium]
MATKFIDLESAAKELGISVDKLAEMREKNEIRGFRDGATWKFKPEDIERLKASIDAGGSELDLDDRDSSAQLDIPDSILLSEVELGSAGSVGSSTVIGQSATNDPSDEEFRQTVEALDSSDIQLSSDSLILGGSETGPSSDVSSDVLGGESSGSAADAGSEIQLTGSDDLDIELDLSDSGVQAEPTSDIALGGSDAVSGGDSEVTVTDEDDAVLVLGGAGSDVIGASDSGISLNDPADSGISLEASDMGLGGSVIGSDDSLLLGEEDLLSTSDSATDGSSPSQLQQDDDFLLTPLEDAMAEDSESSSQVIALDDPDSGFDPSSATVMEGGGDVDLAMLGSDDNEGGDAATLIQPEAEPIIVQQATVPELPYSGWNILSLFLCIVLLALSGMLIYDLVRQVWSWEGVHPVNSGLMDAIIGMFR